MGSERRRQPPEVTRRVMQANKGRDTRPELTLRHELHARGLRYRLHPRDVPGCPDLVIRSIRLAVFLDGDMWHGNEHRRRGLDSLADLFPTRTDFWVSKIERNVQRDREVTRQLEQGGWTVVRVWESEVREDLSQVADRILGAVELARRNT
ncbi:MAG: very short patch repair endonuclease [Egibacteraceae bacterium]